MSDFYIAPSNGGLLGQFSALANAGLQAWDQNRRRQQELGVQKAGLLSHGMTLDQNGNPQRTPEAEQAYQEEQAIYNPQTSQSKQVRSAARGLLEKTSPGMGGLITEDMSGYQAKQIMGMAKPEVSGEYGMRGRAMGTNFKANQNAQTTVNKDPELMMNQQRLNGVLRMKDILDQVESGKLKDTDQIKHMLGLEAAKLEAGVNSMGLGMMESQTMRNTLQGDLNNLTERVFGQIKGGNMSPDQIAQARAELDTFTDSYMNQFDQRHQFLKNGSDPSQQQVVDQKINPLRSTYQKRFGYWHGLQDQDNGPHQSGSGLVPKGLVKGPPLAPQDQAAIEWAKQNSGDPRAQKILKMNGM